MEIACFGMTDVGRKREKNEDAYLINTDVSLYVVADGMGGHLGGEYASKLAVGTIEEIINEITHDPEMTLQSNFEIKPGDYKSYLKYAISVASSHIFDRALRDPSLHGMGTTVVAAIFYDGKVYIANVGDSRCYLIRGNRIKQLTTDHSLVGEQIQAGIITLADAKNHKFRNIITRSVGFQEEVDVDIDAKTIKAGDKFLLCSDGLTNLVSNDEILSTVKENSLRDACRNLIELANMRGGDDNITTIITEVLSVGQKSVVDEETLDNS